MGKMFFELTDDDRAALEALRIRMGLRSHAETLRALIRGGSGETVAASPSPAPLAPGRASVVMAKRSKTTVVSPAAPVRVVVPTYERPAFNPRPKSATKR